MDEFDGCFSRFMTGNSVEDELIKQGRKTKSSLASAVVIEDHKTSA